MLNYPLLFYKYTYLIQLIFSQKRGKFLHSGLIQKRNLSDQLFYKAIFYINIQLLYKYLLQILLTLKLIENEVKIS